MKSSKRIVILLVSAALGIIGGAVPLATLAGPDDHGHEESTRISAETARSAGITTEVAGPGALRRTLTTYGRLAAPPEATAQVRARFPGVAAHVAVALGQPVEKGQVLADIEANESLRRYSVRAPVAGVVVAQGISTGEVADGQVLFTIADLKTLVAELRVFPAQRAEVRTGQRVAVSAEGAMHKAAIASLVPSMDGAPYSIARVRLANGEGQWAPGQLVRGDIVVEDIAAPLVVDNRALQAAGDDRVVFVQRGDSYESRPVTLGRCDARVTEVLDGLRVGERYVVENSYLVKADIEKSAASHSH